MLHQRVHYITGGTGIGKSSIVPSLYMYYLKSLENKLTGGVICTQPRQKPTKDTAKNTGMMWGLPITTDHEKFIDNYNVQMVYQKKKHRSKDNILFVRISTDGSLLMDLQNPMLKKPKGINRGSQDYHKDNMYDVIIIDEAHEHNANMDIILSMLRNIAHYNNDIKVVIMSATMDDDEPVYRRYYRNINDNRKYPLDRWIEKHQLDRINIDRRLHIAQPGSETRYPIDEHYVPEHYDTADELTAKIMNTSNDGHALLFRPGQGEIKKSVDYINNHTGPNVIALPFYAALPDDIKSFIEDANENLNKLKIGKDEDISQHDKKSIEDGGNNYNRCVIVATNMAEASITINNLKYVIETGQQKKMIYNYIARSALLETVGIAESSRMQRRGRVGRTSSGTVYYTYENGKMSKNRFMFDISISDVSMNILGFMRDSNDEKPFLQIDPNSPDLDEQNNTKRLVNRLDNGYDEIIRNQYFIGKEFYAYQGNSDHYDYHNYKLCHLFYQTGFSYNDVLDNDGTFYIIHPDELEFTRNINGEIVELLNDKVTLEENSTTLNTIKSNKMQSFFDSLLKTLMIAFVGTKGGKVIKTDIGKHIHEIFGELQQSNGMSDDINDVLMLIYAEVFNCTEAVVRYLAMRNAIGTKFNNLFTKLPTGGVSPLTKIKNNLRIKDSDIYALIELSLYLENYLKRTEIPISFRDAKYMRKIGSKVDSDSMDQIKELLNGEVETLNDIKLREKLTEYTDVIIKYLNSDENYKVKDTLSKACNKLGINEDVAKDYLYNYLSIQRQLLMFNIKNKRKETVPLSYFGEKMKAFRVFGDKNNALTNTLLLAKPHNIVKFMPGTDNKYLSVFNPTIRNIFSYSTHPYKGYHLSLMEPKYTKDYLYYDTFNSISNSFTLTHKIRARDMYIISHIYTLYEIMMRYNKENHNEHKSIDDIHAKNAYTNVFNKIYADLLMSRDDSVWGVLPQIDTKFRDYADLMASYENN
jgi:hypothetical protein